MSGYSVATVANAILELAWRQGESVSPLKLQKLIYLAHGLHLALYGKPLINTTVEAWKYGPVVAPLYYELREYGSSPIKRPVRLESEAMFSDEADEVSLSSDALKLISDVWEAYGDLDAVALSALTHRGDLPEGRPWRETWDDGGKDRWGTPIHDELIRASFGQLLVPV